MSRTLAANWTVPILLLKTKSYPVDTYEELLAEPSDSLDDDDKDNDERHPFRFEPRFVPVLEHHPVTSALSDLEQKLREGRLKREYGGMIFTSQRAVEAWAEVVRRADSGDDEEGDATSSPVNAGAEQDPFSDLEYLTEFPLYVVGPATERILEALQGDHTPSLTRNRNPFGHLRTAIHGSETGNGANLAAYILQHYNQLHTEHWFNYFEAPRLPFIPLLGMSSENYGRKRLDASDPRLRKKPLLFLVGETRRDIIPKTLHHQSDGKKIDVEEIEVYKTEVMKEFNEHFKKSMNEVSQAGLAIIVIFSPQGSDVMLRSIGYLDDAGNPTEQAQIRAWSKRSQDAEQMRWILVTIGPTTKDYMQTNFGIEPDVCAEKPNPESLKNGIMDFLQRNILVQGA